MLTGRDENWVAVLITIITGGNRHDQSIICYFLLCNAVTYLKCSNVKKFQEEDGPHRFEMLV